MGLPCVVDADHGGVLPHRRALGVVARERGAFDRVGTKLVGTFRSVLARAHPSPSPSRISLVPGVIAQVKHRLARAARLRGLRGRHGGLA